MENRNSRWFILVLGVLTSFGPMAIDLYLPAFSAMAKDLQVPPMELQYTLTSFFIGISIGQLIYGPISDRFGRKRPLLFGISLFIVTSFMIAMAADLPTLVVLRFVQALGSCVGMVITRAIIRDCFDSKDIAKVFSLILLVMGVSPIFAPMLGGQILHFSSWRGLFVFLGIFGLLAMTGTLLVIKETLKESVPLKKSFLNYGHLFADRQFLVASLMSGTIMAAMFSYISSSSIVFMEFFGLGKDLYPLIFGCNAFGFIFVSQVNIRLLRFHSLDKVLGLGMNLFFGISILLGTVTYLEWGVVAFEMVLFLLISCIGVIMPNITAKALEFQSKRAGVASALMGGLQFLIASLGTMFIASFSHLGVWAMVLGVQIFVTISFCLYTLAFKRIDKHQSDLITIQEVQKVQEVQRVPGVSEVPEV